MDPVNSTCLGTTPPTFLCPSDPPLITEVPVGWTHYAGNRGVGVQKYGYNGAFGGPSSPPIRFADFRDGTSHTAAISEWLLNDDDSDERHPIRCVFHTPRVLSEPDQFDEFVAECSRLDTATARTVSVPRGFNWFRGDFGFTLYNHTPVINEHICLNGSGVQTGAWTVSSGHRGGANVAFADGHVQFLKASMARPTWQALGSRNGGEVVSGDGW